MKPAFWVKHIPVFSDAILSPMDGFSDLPFRAMCRQFGSGMSYTEFVNAIDVLNDAPQLSLRLRYAEDERPIVFQLFDDEPDRLLKAALILRERDPDILDINMGCSAKTVAGRGAGAGLLKTPEKIAEIFSRLTKTLDIPVTGKIRLGWDEDSLNHIEVAKIIEDNGGALVAVHGRTKAQSYGGNANWDAIAEVRQAVSIPVLGNGDVRTVADIAHIKAHTGCDGVMIGRAAIGNPWIFSGLDREQVSPEQVRETMLSHLEGMLGFYGAEQGLVLFRKHIKRYIAPYGLDRGQRERFLTSRTAEEFVNLLEDLAVNSLQYRKESEASISVLAHVEA